MSILNVTFYFCIYFLFYSLTLKPSDTRVHVIVFSSVFPEMKKKQKHLIMCAIHHNVKALSSDIYILFSLTHA